MKSVTRLLSHPCLRASLRSSSGSRQFSSSAATRSRDSMHWQAVVLTGRSADTRPAIVVTFDSAKYVFGAAEGTSRSYPESRLRFARTRAIFCERTDIRKMGGLSGMIMGAADAGITKLDVVGPPTTGYVLSMMRNFVARTTLSINCVETVPVFSPQAEPQPTFQDKNVKVYAIHALPETVEGYLDHETYVHICAAMREPVPALPAPPRRRSPPPEDSASPPPKRHHEGSSDSPSKRAKLDGIPYSRHRSGSPGRGRWVPRASGSRDQDFSSTSVPPDADADALEPAPAFVPLARAQVILRHMFPAIVGPAPTDLNYVRPVKKAKPQKRKSGQPDPEPEAELEPEEMPQVRRQRPTDFFTQLEPPFPTRGWVADGAAQVPKGPTLSWLLVGPAIKGKFDAEQATALGVPFGPLRKQLVDGNIVTFDVRDTDAPGGTRTVEVKPEQVVGPTEKPGALFVLNCPSPDFIQPLMDQLAHGSWYSKFSTEESEDHKLRAVFHVCGPRVMQDYRYREFMRMFPESVEHIVSSADHDANPVSFAAAGANQLLLHELDKNIFPKPKHEVSAPLSVFNDLPSKVTPLSPNLVTSIWPPTSPKVMPPDEKIEALHSIFAKDQTPIPKALEKVMEEAKQLVAAELEARAGNPPQVGDDVQFVTLGTGSAVHTRFRGVSSYLIRLPRGGSILLDAGEGTWGQMARLYGTDPSQPNNVWDVLRDLRCIFVSHAHGDHQVGVPLILAKRAALSPPPRDPLWVVSGHRTLLNLREWQEVDDLGINRDTPNGVRLVNADGVHWKRTGPSGRPNYHQPWMNEGDAFLVGQELSQALNLSRISTVDVDHGCKASGVVIDGKEGWRIVYSGDTRPCTQLAGAGVGATLLVHEASFGDDEYEKAEHKKHSTISEAIDIARQMGARNTLLTHFSARYPRTSTRTEARAPGTLVLAIDGAFMRIGDMWKMPLYSNVIKRSIDDLAAGEEDVPVKDNW